jgi:DNA polymerase-3 subunit alpha
MAEPAVTTPETPRFIHLRVRTALSLLQSMIRPKDLAKWAANNGVPAVGVTMTTCLRRWNLPKG